MSVTKKCKKWYQKKKNKFVNSKNTQLANLGNSVGGPQIKLSTLDGVGYGLFAERNYMKLDIITVYGGSLHYKKIEGDYVFRLSETIPLYVDGERDFHPTEKGRWLNHGSEETQKSSLGGAMDPKNVRANTEFYISKKNNYPICYIRALRNILKGEELFIDYGPLYW